MKLKKLGAGCVVAAASLSYVAAQTQIDLRTQAKRVDFSTASSTKPSKTGIVLPAVCMVGETFLKLDAKPGANLYVCTAANVWTVQGSPLPDYVAGSYGKILTNDDTGMGWESLGGDVSGAPDILAVTGLQGRPVAPTAPSSGHVLSWDGTQWTPQPVPVRALTGDVTTSEGSSVTTLSSVNGAPGTCGDATHVCQLTTNAKGLVTQQTPVTVSASGGGINSLNGLSTGNQNFVNDSNVTISSAGSNHTLGWNGVLGLARGGLNSDLSNSGGAHQVLRQSSAGAPVTVGQLTAGDISGLALSATTDATNASNISGGMLPNARLSAVPNSALANSSLTVAAANGLSGGGAAALGGSVTLNAVMVVNAQVGTSYAMVAGDGSKLVTFNNASVVGVTLPQAIGAFGAGWHVLVRNLGAGAVTITPVTSTIDGAGNLVLQSGQGVEIASDGANYQTWRGYTWQPSAAASHQFATAISGAGVVSYAQPGAADISGLAPSATTDATNASNITSGTLGTARMPQFTGGQVTSPAPGSTVLNIGAGQVTNGMLAGAIDASTKFSGIVPATNGGTASGFTAFSGPAGSVKTYTLPNASTTIVTTADAGSVTNAMLAGSIATSKLASKQGTDTNVLTAGTVSGTGAPLCTDANGGATTAGCSSGGGSVTVVAAGNLSNSALVTGGGTQTLQTPAATATMDGSGNIQTPGIVQAGVGSNNAGAWAFGQGAATAAPSNSVGFQAPASVTSAYRITLPGAPAAGYVKRTNATPSVESVSAIAAADLPTPGASSLGGVQSKTCPAGQHVNSISSVDGSVACTADTGGTATGWVAAPTTVHSRVTGTVSNDVTETVTGCAGGTAYYASCQGAACTPITVTAYSAPVSVTPDSSTQASFLSRCEMAHYDNSAVVRSDLTFQVGAVTDSPGAGTYGGAQTVTLGGGSTPDYKCYTTDGTDPTGTGASCTNGTHYTAGFTSPGSTFTLKARGYKNNYAASPIHSAVYTLTGCATPTGTTLTESFGDSSSSCWSGGPSNCNRTWTVRAGTPSIVSSPSGAPANSACANSLNLTPAGASTVYLAYALSEPQTQTADITFAVNFASYTIGNYAELPVVSLTGDQSGNNPRVQITLYNTAGGSYNLSADGSTQGIASEVAVATGTWYTVHVHVQSGANASYVQVNGGTQHTFTQSASDASYLIIGSSGSVTGNYSIGYIDVN